MEWTGLKDFQKPESKKKLSVLPTTTRSKALETSKTKSFVPFVTFCSNPLSNGSFSSFFPV